MSKQTSPTSAFVRSWPLFTRSLVYNILSAFTFLSRDRKTEEWEGLGMWLPLSTCYYNNYFITAIKTTIHSFNQGLNLDFNFTDFFHVKNTGEKFQSEMVFEQNKRNGQPNHKVHAAYINKRVDNSTSYFFPSTKHPRADRIRSWSQLTIGDRFMILNWDRCLWGNLYSF